MNCRTERRWIEPYIDGELDFGSRWLLRRHLTSCTSCFAEYERLERAPRMVKGLRPGRSPRSLRARILLRTSGARDSRIWPRWKVRLQNFFRPLAVPATGGVLSALILFGGLMSNLWFSPRDWKDDVPLTYFADAWISDPVVRIPSPWGISEEITVEAFIDTTGRIYDFRMVHLPSAQPGDVRMQLANALLTTRFAPAMSFGRPVRGKLLIAFVQVDVQG